MPFNKALQNNPQYELLPQRAVRSWNNCNEEYFLTSFADNASETVCCLCIARRNEICLLKTNKKTTILIKIQNNQPRKQQSLVSYSELRNWSFIEKARDNTIGLSLRPAPSSSFFLLKGVMEPGPPLSSRSSLALCVKWFTPFTHLNVLAEVSLQVWSRCLLDNFGKNSSFPEREQLHQLFNPSWVWHCPLSFLKVIRINDSSSSEFVSHK